MLYNLQKNFRCGLHRDLGRLTKRTICIFICSGDKTCSQPQFLKSCRSMKSSLKSLNTTSRTTSPCPSASPESLACTFLSFFHPYLIVSFTAKLYCGALTSLNNYHFLLPSPRQYTRWLRFLAFTQWPSLCYFNL